MNSKISLLVSFSLFLFGHISFAQMMEGGATLYGDEWIDYSQEYYKIRINEDGIYRVSYADLNAAGVFSGATPTGAEFKLFRLGQEVPIFVSNSGTFTSSDFIEFYGEKNRGEVDKYLYEFEEYQLNEKVSLFTEDAIYFLTWNSGVGSSFSNIPNDLSNPPSPETHCLYEEELIYDEKVDYGYYNGGSSDWRCPYDLGEGFGKNTLSASQSFQISVNDLHGTGAGEIAVRLLSRTSNHDISINLNGTTITNDSYNGWAVKQYIENVNNIVNGNNTIDINGNASADDKFRVAHLSIRYPRMFNFNSSDNVEFTIPSGVGDRYLEVNNFNHGGQAPILFDLTNNIRIQATLSGSTVRVVLPASSGDRRIVLSSTSAIMSPLDIVKRQFVEYDFTGNNFDYLMVTHPSFFNDGAGNNYVQEYADYRSSIQGGSYSSLIVDVTQLYDQFGYGIDRHEQAIKNFLKKASLSWQSKLVVFIGKGVVYEKMKQNPSDWQQFSFVPSFGYPTSDHLFVTDLGGTDPWMGVGRIAIKNPAQLKLYLDKVREHESAQVTSLQSIEDKAWMKRVLQFGGGDENIQNFIKSELNTLGDSLEVSAFGADVISFFKNSTGTIDNVDLDQVKPLIDNGASMLTFFGHSAPSTLDFDLGDPSEFDNQGKYPLFYAIGCNTNRIFEVESSLSEDFVFVEGKGCIGFFGATWVTNLGNLSQYARYFYDNMGNDEYGNTIGEIIKATIEDYNFSNSYTAELLRNALTLHGDPAIRMNPHAAPDYIVDVNSSSIEPSIINAEQDSFDFRLSIKNIGLSITDSCNVKLEQELPDGSLVDLGTYRIEAPNYEYNADYRLPVISSNALGANQLVVTVDVDDEIQEGPSSAEFNNTERIPFFIVANDIFPLFPYEYSIVNTTPTLKASTANTFSEELNYYIEIDTTEFFNSPLKRGNTISQVGGVLEWTPSIPMIDNTVYYWRVSIDSTETSGGGFKWRNSSFIYIDGGPEGWNQSHYFQLTNNTFQEEFIDSTTRAQYYAGEDVPFRIYNGVIGVIGQGQIAIYKDIFKDVGYWPCGFGQNNIVIAVYDKTNLEMASSDDPNPPAFSCWGPNPILWFMANPNIASERERTMQFLENEVKDGNYVFFFTTQTASQDHGINDWESDLGTYGNTIFDILEAQGAVQIRNLKTNPTPYGLIYQHNTPGGAFAESHAPNLSEIIEVEAVLTGIASKGGITSTVIGPASSWDNMLWQVSDYDNTTENVNVDIYGIDENGNSTLLVDSVTVYNQVLSSYSADDYPYLQLVYNTQDTINRTPPQLDYWRVHYTPTPEAALVPNKQFAFVSDTLQEGQPLHLEIGLENISEVDMDSMLMHYTIIDANNNQVVESQRLQPLLKDDILVAELDYPTLGLVGDNQIIIEANPNDDQPELYHFNNIAARNFHVLRDMRNPLMDVTFDGIHIMDGDLVSAEPEIMVTLEDENKYLALSDSSVFRVFVTDPSDNIQEYYMDGSTLIFIPADNANLSQENKARLEFRPAFTEDGIYELRVVSEDVSGNDSGDLDYRVNFEVITEELVSNVLNYPNPFSTSTQFVFTLTGNELPDYMKIQIMTVSGKVVREITMDELGAVRIGNNISDYRWDGTDEYGDKLANGVYMYRVMVQKDGQDYDKYDTNTDQYFKRGFGKLMILR